MNQTHETEACFRSSFGSGAFDALRSRARENGFVLSGQQHLEGSVMHGVDCTYDSYLVRLEQSCEHIRIVLSAPDSSSLYFLRESITRQIQSLDASAAAQLRWSNTSASDYPPNFSLASVVSSESIMPNMVRLTLETSSVERFVGAGMHVKLMHPEPGHTASAWPRLNANGTTCWPAGKDSLHVRYYTVRAIDVQKQCLSIDLVTHAHGTFGQLALSLVAGDTLGLMGPCGAAEPELDGHFVLAGDATALPAMARILESRALRHCQDLQGHVIVPDIDHGDITKYLPPGSYTLSCIAEHDFHDRILSRISDIGRFDHLWFAGEATTVVNVRRWLKEQSQLCGPQVKAGAYWRKGTVTDATL